MHDTFWSLFKRNHVYTKYCRFLLADGQILPTSRRQDVFPNGTLVLHRVDSSTDRGAYTCTAKNKQGRSDSQTIHIEVKGKVSRYCTRCVPVPSFLFVFIDEDLIRLNWSNSVPREHDNNPFYRDFPRPLKSDLRHYKVYSRRSAFTMKNPDLSGKIA